MEKKRRLKNYARRRGEHLAGLGNVAFLLEMYGEDRPAHHSQEAGKWSK